MENAVPTDESILRIGSYASVIQSFLFVVIAVTALWLGVDRLIEQGSAAMFMANPTVFRVLCMAFVAIAVLGLAITPAEQQIIAAHNTGLAAIGGNLAYLGHAATIVFFSWWLLVGNWHQRDLADPAVANLIMPIQWGVLFELLFVGAWVWIFVYVVFRYDALSRAFGWLSIAKATSFWLAGAALLLNHGILLVVGLSGTAIVFGPWWHLWIARVCWRDGKGG